MKSYDIVEWGKPLQVVLRETPVPSGSEVRVKVEACGVCHSDLHIREGALDLGNGRRIAFEFICAFSPDGSYPRGLFLIFPAKTLARAFFSVHALLRIGSGVVVAPAGAEDEGMPPADGQALASPRRRMRKPLPQLCGNSSRTGSCQPGND